MANDAAEANKSSDPMGALMERRKYKGQSFASAFREARSSGDKTFFWNGKKYNTDVAPAKPVPPAGEPGGAFRSRRSASDEDMGREGRRTPRAPAAEASLPSAPPRRPEFKLSDVERPGTRVRYDNEDTSDMAYAKGGSVKGGSVKGGGCEQRGLRKCKVM